MAFIIFHQPRPGKPWEQISLHHTWLGAKRIQQVWDLYPGRTKVVKDPSTKAPAYKIG